MKMKKRKIVLYGLAALVALGLFAMLSLKTWASYRLKQANWQHSQQMRANTPPEGKNLLETPLWLDFLKESVTRIETPGTEEEIAAGWPERTNALSRWNREQTAKRVEYDRIRPVLDKNMELRPGNLDSTEREALPTFEALQKGPERAGAQPLAPELSSIIQKYEARAELSDEEKVLTVLLEYFQSGDPATEAEIKKSLAESSYFGNYVEVYAVYVKQGLPEEVFLLNPLRHLAPLKALGQHYGQMARWHAYLGQREEALEELQPLLELAGLEGYNSTLIEGLVRNALRITTAVTVHTLILEGAFTQEDLLSIQTRFSRMNIMEDLRQTLEGEEAFYEKMFRLYFDPSLKKGFWERFATRFVGFSGYMDLNKAAIFEAMRGLRAAIDTEGQTLDEAAWEKAVDLPKSFFNILARQMIPAIEKTSNKFLQIQSHRDAVILGCALERYWLSEGAYPEELAALIPDYLEAMPPGSLSQGSLSYTRTEKGYELTLNKLPELPKEDRMETIWIR